MTQRSNLVSVFPVTYSANWWFENIFVSTGVGGEGPAPGTGEKEALGFIFSWVFTTIR